MKPGSYKPPELEKPDTSTWVWQYADSGVLPDWGSATKPNELQGTTWVLKKFVTEFATIEPNDTIRFVNNRYYTINSGAVIPYSLSFMNIVTSSKTLTLYYFYPFGSGHYSGQINPNFLRDAELNNIEFKNIETSSIGIKAWLIKI